MGLGGTMRDLSLIKNYRKGGELVTKDINMIKLRFAVLFLKNGKNAAAAARELGLSKSTGDRYKRDPIVTDYISQISAGLNLDQLSQVHAAEIGGDIADIKEVLAILTEIARGRRKDETVVVVKEESTKWDGKRKTTTRREVPKIVELATRNADIVRAASELLKYLDVNKDSEDAEAGVVILPAADIGGDNGTA